MALRVALQAAAAPAAAAAAPSKPAEEVDPELAAFAAEITAIDPEALQGTAEARASTPPPNEQRFVDDDGTVSQLLTHSRGDWKA